MRIEIILFSQFSLNGHLVSIHSFQISIFIESLHRFKEDFFVHSIIHNILVSIVTKKQKQIIDKEIRKYDLNFTYLIV